LDDIFSSLLNDSAFTGSDTLPTMDVYIEDDKRLVAEVHLPGFSPEDVEIRVQDNMLEIRGEREESIEDEDKKRRGYLVRQSVARFFRRIALPNNVDADQVQADFEDSVLRVVVPLTTEQESKRVTVNAGGSGRGSKKSGSRGRQQDE
jgi:HSP20 family protein